MINRLKKNSNNSSNKNSSNNNRIKKIKNKNMFMMDMIVSVKKKFGINKLKRILKYNMKYWTQLKE